MAAIALHKTSPRGSHLGCTIESSGKVQQSSFSQPENEDRSTIPLASEPAHTSHAAQETNFDSPSESTIPPVQIDMEKAGTAQGKKLRIGH